MTSTVWRDGYGLTVEIVHGTPEVCPDGAVRVWHDVTVWDDDAPADAIAFRIAPAALAELGNVLHAVAKAVTP
jgi:hypothetical protein